MSEKFTKEDLMNAFEQHKENIFKLAQLTQTKGVSISIDIYDSGTVEFCSREDVDEKTWLAKKILQRKDAIGYEEYEYKR